MEEQMALILRFNDKNNIIREQFVSFLQCKNGLTGVACIRPLIKLYDQ